MTAVLKFLVLSLWFSSVLCLWPHLRTTWTVIASNGFDSQPRTMAELQAENWVQISSCADANPNFPGERYARSPADNDIVLIFDENGFIAGMQTIVPLEKANNDLFFPYANSPWYQLGDFFGSPVYFATVYFVDPSTICNGGRTQADFDAQGTGYAIYLQNGPTSSDVYQVQLNEQDAINDGFFLKHNCFKNMGNHFFTFAKDPTQSCDESIPFQIVYSGGELNGIVFQHIADLDSARFELVNRQAIDSIIDTAPTCLYDLIIDPGIKTMHVYVDEYIVDCPAKN